MNKRLKKVRELARHLQRARDLREPRWRELSRWICPYRGVFETDLPETPDTSRRQLLRFTHCASQALLRGASGMTSGMTPRNISWFKPDFTIADLVEEPGARPWLDAVDKAIKACLSDGGFYQAIQTFNIDLLWSGCALLHTEKGANVPLRFECVQIGSFLIGLDREGRLETVIRCLAMTPQSIEQTFGRSRMCERSIQRLQKEPYAPARVWHLVRPRAQREVLKSDSQNMPFESLYWEDEATEGFLRESGFHEMPFFFTVWHEGIGPYGTGPGDEALPDARQMDMLERRKLEGLGKLVDPPTQANSSLKNAVDLGPGKINYVPDRTMIEPIIDLGPYARSLGFLREEIQTVSQRLEQTLMASIFASIPMDQRPRDMSATEFLERKRETLQQLGPVISAYEPNVLTPLLHRVIQTLDRESLLPPPPQSLQGIPLLMKMDFISPMTNALRQTGAETVRAILSDVGSILQTTQQPEVLDKIDLDQAIDELAAGLGVPGKVIRADKDVESIRAQRQQQQAAQAQMQAQAIQAQTQASQASALRDEAQAINSLNDGGEGGMG